MDAKNDKDKEQTTRKAVIIGATSGIGLDVARLLHNDGWTIGIAGRREDRLKEIASKLGGRVAWLPIDVTNSDADERLNKLINELGEVDLIFISAGVGWQNLQMDIDKEMVTVNTNAMGFTRMITAAYHYFATIGKGHIACISSIAGTKGLGTAPAYSATKRYQNAYIQCLAQQTRMKRLDICFTDIRPGFVDTPLIADSKFPMKMKSEYVARSIVKAIYARKRKVTIDWRYRLLVSLWRLIPDWLWERMTFVC